MSDSSKINNLEEGGKVLNMTWKWVIILENKKKKDISGSRRKCGLKYQNGLRLKRGRFGKNRTR